MFVRELAGALDAAVLATRLAGARGLAWLDSDGSGGDAGRYSFLGAEPCEVQRLEVGELARFARLDALAREALEREALRPGAPTRGASQRAAGDREPLAHGRPAQDDAGLAAAGGDAALALPPQAADVPAWIGYLAYDATSGRSAGELAQRAQPAIMLARYEALLALDHGSGRSWVVGDDEAACDRLLARSAGPALALAARAGRARVAPPQEHARAIAAALERIAAGDLYQVNLARRFEARLEGHPLALALAMRAQSPVPLGLYFDDGERCVIGRSMERFLRWERASGRLYTRPIKGTLARAGDDGAERRALVQDPKEHAEHAMIVDLMRNDLSRVAQLGSVRVEQCMVVEPFARLHHLVSTVACRTRPEVEPSDILSATFPPGSVTGTPKLRAVETIAALEAAPRGIYTGALGFIDRAGGLSLAVAIRSAVVSGGVAEYFAGGGIVEASRIDREIAETELKARVFMDALAALPRLEDPGQ